MPDAKSKIVLVDANPTLLDVLGKLFEFEGYEVIPVARYEDVLLQLPGLKADAVFVHFRSQFRQNPLQSGQEVIRAARQLGLPVVVTSAGGPLVVQSSLEKIPECSGYHFWQMDSGPDNLFTTLRAAMGH